jgi:hypothetical protein
VIGPQVPHRGRAISASVLFWEVDQKIDSHIGIDRTARGEAEGNLMSAIWASLARMSEIQSRTDQMAPPNSSA